MEIEKTGKLIAEVRREKGMTQKELAAQLHVSDRAVSKWERGAGFPDVALLEGLAEALDLTVTDLLRGERQPIPAADSEIASTILATDSYLAELMTLYPTTYHLADLGHTHYNDG